ncbi:MAG: hypothetical protein IJ519_01940, partial [Clostridia bacterium]|nr:hypothetical protein [Clostridia bacterium]
MTYNPSFYDSFDPAVFENGTQDGCGVVYAWVWNTVISRELISSQLKEMRDAGVRCFYVLPEPAHFRPTFMRTRLSPEYLSEDFFALIRYTAEVARDLGMTMWLYDEGGWPSGSACGEVTKDRPDLLTLCLHKEEVTLGVGTTFTGDENIVSAFSGGRRVSLPFKCSSETSLTVYSRINPNDRFPYLLKEEAIHAFIDSTYEKYRRCLGDLFGSTVQAVFTDEATLHYPFCLLGDDLKGFEEEYGYDFADMVPALFDGTDGVSATFRADYIDYCGTLFAGRYLHALRQWCHRAGIALTGHMNGDHDLYAFDMSAGNLLTHLRCMDVPGVDAISRQIHPSAPATSFPRFASSAAAQTGAEGVLSESLGVYGALPYSEIRYVCGHQLVRGVNILNFMVIPAGRDGYLG